MPHNLDSVEEYRRRRDNRIKARFDAGDKDIDWITVHGNKVPLIDGVAVGGHYKGQKFLKATTTKTSGTRTRTKSTVGRSGGVGANGGKTEQQPKISATHQKFKDRLASLTEKRIQAEKDTKYTEDHVDNLRLELGQYKRVKLDGVSREELLDNKESIEGSIKRGESILREARKYKKIMESNPDKDSRQYKSLDGYLRILGVKSKSKEVKQKTIEDQIRRCSNAIRCNKNEKEIIDEYLKDGTQNKKQELINKVTESIESAKRKVEKSKSDAEKYKEQRKNLVNSRLKSINDCKDSEDIKERILNSGLYDVREKVKDPVFGVYDVDDLDSHTSIGKCDFKIAKEMCGYAESFFERYPRLKGLFKPFDCYRGDINDENASSINRAFANCKLSNGKVSFNLGWFDDESKFEESEKKMKKSGHRAVYGKKAVIFHEYGHAMDGLLTRGLRKNGGINDYENFSDTVIKKCMDKFKKNEMDIHKELCHYGVGDRSEFLAEAFAEYTCSEKPRRIAAYVGKLIEDEMKRQKYL